ncbi:rRNA maturation RNase YbeY [Sphingomonas bacterium]|uniref:rRNA maturation RNase YbeY n=1 Tax=Sphingomonas bacterium TaxID=1895847 RepID=UPI00157581A4|nr:rRNA maturation RNase YbeY [Sphingomonas bacterium]
MIQVEVSCEQPWPDAGWDVLALNAATAAIERTPHGAMLTTPAVVEISVRLTTDDEVRTLNHRFRGKDKATNVLSFPMVQPDLLDTMDATGDADAGGASTTGGELLLGDIVLAHGTCVAEAAERRIPVASHATHLIVHGTLHLLGYDHTDDPAAEDMEAIERAALAALGIADPYSVREE